MIFPSPQISLDPNSSLINRVVLDIGCGSSKLQGSIGIDRLPYPGVDLVGDVFDVLSTFGDHSVDYIHTRHFLEHLSDIARIVDEFSRVLKPGAIAEIIVPHFSNPYFYSDPTHKSAFGLYTFCYFADPGLLFRRTVPAYCQKQVFALTHVELRFFALKGRLISSIFKKLLTKIVNLSPGFMEFYEETFCYIVPCYEVAYKITRIPLAPFENNFDE
jgi:SAM-dependent methyltransferase